MKTKIIFQIKDVTERKLKELSNALKRSEEIILSDAVQILIKNKDGYWEKIE